MVINQNDLYIQAISLDPDLTSSVGSESVALQTGGGETVYFHGENIGRITNETAVDSISVTYGKTGTEYVASNCSILIPYYTAQCTSAPGSGKDHVWKFKVHEISGIELYDDRQACAGVDTGCIFDMYAPYANRYYALTNWLVASKPWNGVNKKRMANVP